MSVSFTAAPVLVVISVMSGATFHTASATSLNLSTYLRLNPLSFAC